MRVLSIFSILAGISASPGRSTASPHLRGSSNQAPGSSWEDVAGRRHLQDEQRHLQDVDDGVWTDAFKQAPDRNDADDGVWDDGFEQAPVVSAKDVGMDQCSSTLRPIVFDAAKDIMGTNAWKCNSAGSGSHLSSWFYANFGGGLAVDACEEHTPVRPSYTRWNNFFDTIFGVKPFSKRAFFTTVCKAPRSNTNIGGGAFVSTTYFKHLDAIDGKSITVTIDADQSLVSEPGAGASAFVVLNYTAVENECPGFGSLRSILEHYIDSPEAAMYDAKTQLTCWLANNKACFEGAIIGAAIETSGGASVGAKVTVAECDTTKVELHTHDWRPSGSNNCIPGEHPRQGGCPFQLRHRD